MSTKNFRLVPPHPLPPSPKLTTEAQKVCQVYSDRKTGHWAPQIVVFFMMISLTMIARVADGLPLAASIQEDEQVSMEASFSM